MKVFSIVAVHVFHPGGDGTPRESCPQAVAPASENATCTQEPLLSLFLLILNHTLFSVIFGYFRLKLIPLRTSELL